MLKCVSNDAFPALIFEREGMNSCGIHIALRIDQCCQITLLICLPETVLDDLYTLLVSSYYELIQRVNRATLLYGWPGSYCHRIVIAGCCADVYATGGKEEHQASQAQTGQ